jgi:aryl-alcohol dehydrogenase-like predicted oxidoreductase
MMFGRQTAFEDAANIMASAKAHGINLIDTADVYNHGQSGARCRLWLQGQRHDSVLASKLGNPVSDAPNEGYHSLADPAKPTPSWRDCRPIT